MNKSSTSATDLEEIEPVPRELRSLYGKLFRLSNSPAAIPEDLRSPRQHETRERIDTYRLQAMRNLVRSLDAEAKTLAAYGKTTHAAELALGQVQLGEIWGRNGLMIDALVDALPWEVEEQSWLGFAIRSIPRRHT